MTSDRNRLVFHGTRAPAGTSSKTLYPPSYDHPFFVADNPKIAISYINTYSGSIFVLRLKEPPLKVAFDFKNKSHMDALSAKIPITTEFIENFLQHSGKNTFFGASKRLDSAINFTEQYSIYTNERVSKSYELERRALVELGILEYDDVNGFGLMKNVKDLGGVGTTRRRFIKSKIYEKIGELGYSIAMDDDTSDMNYRGNEFAIFNLDVIEDGITESVYFSDIMKTVKYFYPKEGLK